MIPKDHITAWRAQAPWLLAAQVEQDLVISRVIVDLFDEAQDRDQHTRALHRARCQARAPRSGKPMVQWCRDRLAYAIDELLCTKLRALYQRKKGRDLFDLWYAMDQGRMDPPTLLGCFERYMDKDERTVTRAQFEANLSQKRKQPDFRDDVGPLLRPGFTWNFDAAMDAVLANLVAHLPGEPWKGEDG